MWIKFKYFYDCEMFKKKKGIDSNMIHHVDKIKK